MSEIRVSTDNLHSGAKNLHAVANEMKSSQSQIDSVLTSVGSTYNGQLKDKVEGIAGGSAQTGIRLQSRAIDLGEELLARAVGFESANEFGKGTVLDVSKVYSNFIETTPTLGFLSFFSKFDKIASSLWDMGGLAIGGFLSLIFVGVKPEISTRPPKPSQSSTTVSEKTKLGLLMEEYEREKRKTAKPTQPQNPETPVEKYDVYYNIPAISQGTRFGNAACLPTSMSMVLDYYHDSNSNLKSATADELIIMLDYGDGTKGNGIRLDGLDDDIKELGYESNVTASDIGGLVSELKEGPVIVNVGVQLESSPRDIKQAGSTNHAMLVKALNENTVVVNDPWSGSEKVFSRKTFEGMWSNGHNYMVTVRPQEK